jgi:phosphoglycerate dehydrogenase-like enzyme
MLAALRRTPRCDREIKTRGFAETQKEFFAEGQHELANRHIGLIGIGAIGREVARRLIFWGCKISYYDVFRPDTETESSLNLAYLPLNELLASCDIISLHVPALPETVNMLSRPQFEMMKAGVLVINTARGELINAGDLAWALETGRVYGAALDTISPEPAPSDHPLLNLSPNAERRLILTPHAGGTTDEAFTRMLKNAVANILAVESGARPVNDVSR